jgi:predicted esterase YcpF (UPF0227 family)
MKNIFILNGFEANPDSNWFPWLETTLEQKGHQVITLAWPNSHHPDSAIVLPWIEAQLPDDLSNVVLIGHSLGAFWAAKIAETHAIAHLILVAPAVHPLPLSQLQHHPAWAGSDLLALKTTIDADIDWKQIKSAKKSAIFSVDDPWIPVANAALFAAPEWTTVVLDDKRGHICTLDLPELLPLI